MILIVNINPKFHQSRPNVPQKFDYITTAYLHTTLIKTCPLVDELKGEKKVKSYNRHCKVDPSTF